jgi:hypothetical protein
VKFGATAPAKRIPPLCIGTTWLALLCTIYFVLPPNGMFTNFCPNVRQRQSPFNMLRPRSDAIVCRLTALSTRSELSLDARVQLDRERCTASSILAPLRRQKESEI